MKCRVCGRAAQAGQDTCHECSCLAPLEERTRARLDYWRMVLWDSEEGSGVRAIADRMVSKYTERLREEMKEDAEVLHEIADDRAGAGGGQEYADAGAGDGVLSAGEPVCAPDAAGKGRRKRQTDPEKDQGDRLTDDPGGAKAGKRGRKRKGKADHTAP